MIIFYIAVGGFFGAISRFAISNYFSKVSKMDIPLGTIFVNLLGAFLLGLFVQLGLSGSANALIAIGFLGSFTTFSTVMLEMVQMIKSGNRIVFFTYFFISYVGGILCAFMGMWLSS